MKRVCRTKKKQYNENELLEIEGKFQKKEIRLFYQKKKRIRKGYQTDNSYSCIEDVVVMWARKVYEWMEKHFQELLNGDEKKTKRKAMLLTKILY